MGNEGYATGCSHCGGQDFAVRVRIGQTAEVGHIGLSYKDGLLLVGTEPLRVDVCTACGTIRRLYVENVDHRWVTR
ncbi:MAG: hypothetical protein FJ280_27850 [Planctomycetes bacterium]|nr:hypothetical protein [Planctomycetota bacterium]